MRTQIQRIVDTVQNAAVNLLRRKCGRKDISKREYMRKYHWLRVRERIIFKICLLMQSNTSAIITDVAAKSHTIQCIREDAKTGATIFSFVLWETKLHKNWATFMELVAVQSERPL